VNNALKWIGAISGIVFGCGSGAFAYLQYSSQQARDMGRVEAENTYLRDQLAQAKQDKAKWRSDLDAWDVAYRKKEDELASARSRLASVQNGECNEIWQEILSLENDLSWASARQYSSERREELRSEITEHKKTHQVCLASRR
jgi:hypothetical protein